jgi:hypothetical protein
VEECRQFTCRIPAWILAELDKEAAESDRTLSRQIIAVLRQHCLLRIAAERTPTACSGNDPAPEQSVPVQPLNLQVSEK